MDTKVKFKPYLGETPRNDFELTWDEGNKVLKIAQDGKVYRINKVLYKSNTKPLQSYVFEYSTGDWLSLYSEVENAKNPDSVADEARWVNPRMGAVKITYDGNTYNNYPIYSFYFLNDAEDGKYARPFKTRVRFTVTGYIYDRAVTQVEYFDAYGKTTTPKYKLYWSNGFTTGADGNEAYYANPLYMWGPQQANVLPTKVGQQKIVYFPWCRYFNGTDETAVSVTFLFPPQDTLESVRQWDRYKNAAANCFLNYAGQQAGGGSSKSLKITEDGTDLIHFNLKESTFSGALDSAENLIYKVHTTDSVLIGSGDFSTSLTEARVIKAQFEYSDKVYNLELMFDYAPGEKTSTVYYTLS